MSSNRLGMSFARAVCFDVGNSDVSPCHPSSIGHRATIGSSVLAVFLGLRFVAADNYRLSSTFTCLTKN